MTNPGKIGPVINQRVPSDIFDRQAGWGHSATTQLNFASGSNVTVQAVWNDPYQQFQTGDANDITGAQSIQIPQIGSNSDLGFDQAQQTSAAVARDGVVSAVTTGITPPTASFNSTYNGTTTSQTYSTLAAKQSYTVNYGGTAQLGNTDQQQGSFATVLADRFWGFGHGSATTYGQAYNTSTTIAVSAPGLSTYAQQPYDATPNDANYQPILPSPLLGQLLTSHNVGGTSQYSIYNAANAPLRIVAASSGQALSSTASIIWVSANPATNGFTASGTLAVFNPYTDETVFVTYTSTQGGASNNFQGCTYTGTPFILQTGMYVYQATTSTNINEPVASYLDPAWGGVNDRTTGWGHTNNPGGTVSMAGQTVNLPAMHD